MVFDGADKTNFHLENVKNDGSTVFGSVNSLDSLVVFKQKEFKITGSDSLKKVDFSGQIIKNENSSFDAVVGNEYSIFLLQSINNQPSSRVIRLRNKNLTTLYENYNVEGLQNLLYDDLNHILWVGTLNGNENILRACVFPASIWRDGENLYKILERLQICIII